MKMDAVGLFVTDMEKMVKFYRDVMQMTADWNGAANAELYSEGNRLILFGRKDFEAVTGRSYGYPKGMNGTMELSFGLADVSQVDLEYQRVVEAGGTPVFPPADMPWGQRTSYVGDPDGNLIELSAFYPAAEEPIV